MGPHESTNQSCMNVPAVSIIVNVRNGAATLEAALRSALAQSFQDWEMVVWDDGSVDESAAVVAQLADPRLRYWRSDLGGGLGPARARAITVARGQWLAFLDQDDLWLPDKLRLQMALTAPGVGLVYGRAVMFFEDGRQRDFDHWHEYEALPEGHIFEALFACSCFICMSTALLRRDLVEAAGAMPAWVRVAPDYFLFLELAHSHQACAVQAPVCLYRVHGGGMTGASMAPIQHEALLLIERWRGVLPDALVRQRKRVHHTVLASIDMRSGASFGAGCRRLLRQGSLVFLLTRPFARAARHLRRRLQRPYWVQALRRSGTALPALLSLDSR